MAVAVPTGLNHVAMSVPAGTLTDEFRAEVVAFYGGLLGWREIEALRLPDRMTLSVSRHTYVNIRERPDVMTSTGYEHFGVVVASAGDAKRLWHALDSDPRAVNLEPLSQHDDGFTSFRFRYLLPLAVEIQYFP